MSKRKLQIAEEYAQINDVNIPGKKKSKKELQLLEQKREEEKKIKNKQKVLILSSRGTGSRFRHFLNDLRVLLPHHKKEMKMDQKEKISTLNEVCEIRNCNNCIYLEIRKKTDCYMWISKTPNGPSIKFHVENVHTLGELKLTGNCLMGSRPLVMFDKSFDNEPHYRLLKELMGQIFSTPKGHPNSKPFHDHIFCFFIQDNRVWFRNYQIVELEEKKKIKHDLVEVGPRFILNPIRMFAGSFGGPTLWLNGDYVSPNETRQEASLQPAARYQSRKIAKQKYAKRKKIIQKPIEDELEDVFQ